MATKKTSKKNTLTMLTFEADVKFSVVVPEAEVVAFKKDLARNELNLSAKIELNDIYYSFSIYSDHVLNGQLKFDLSGNICTVSLAGRVTKEFDNQNDGDLIAAVSSGENVIAQVLSVTDSRPTDYYIDGDEEKYLDLGQLYVVSQ
jgi:hypothetical protein